MKTITLNPIPGLLVADLTHDQKVSVRQRLDEMVQDRVGRHGAATLTAPLNIGIGSK